MSNNQLPADVQERIKADANKATAEVNDKLREKVNDFRSRTTYVDGYHTGYIAGATAENKAAEDWRLKYETVSVMLDTGVNNYNLLKERAQVLVDALRVISELDTPISLDEYKTAFEYITKSIAATALQQFKKLSNE